MNCEFCQSPVHIWFQCPKKPDGWKPARLAKKSTAPLGSRTSRSRSANESLPVDTIGAPPMDGGENLKRHTAGFDPQGAPAKFDKKAWQREYMREYMRKRRAKNA